MPQRHSLLSYLSPFPSGEQFRKTQAPTSTSPNIIHGNAKLSAGTTHYTIRSPAKPSSTTPIVLVHGLSFNEIWDDVAKFLYERDNRIVITYDNYGRGYSSAPDLPHTAELYTTQLSELMYYLNITEPIDLMGMSQGGAIVTLFASRFPQKISRLALIAPAGLPVIKPKIAFLVLLPILGEWFYHSTFTQTYRAAYLKQFQYHDSDAFQKAWTNVSASIKEHPGFVTAVYSSLVDFPMGECESQIKELGKTFDKPSIVLMGTHDSLMPYKTNKAIYERVWPNLQIVTIENGHHMFCLERSEETYTYLKEFLSK